MDREERDKLWVKIATFSIQCFCLGSSVTSLAYAKQHMLMQAWMSIIIAVITCYSLYKLKEHIDDIYNNRHRWY